VSSSVQCKPYFAERRRWYFCPPFHIYCLIWIKFSISDIRAVLLSICKFQGNRRRQGRNFRLELNEFTVLSGSLELIEPSLFRYMNCTGFDPQRFSLNQESYYERREEWFVRWTESLSCKDHLRACTGQQGKINMLSPPAGQACRQSVYNIFIHKQRWPETMRLLSGLWAGLWTEINIFLPFHLLSS